MKVDCPFLTVLRQRELENDPLMHISGRLPAYLVILRKDNLGGVTFLHCFSFPIVGLCTPTAFLFSRTLRRMLTGRLRGSRGRLGGSGGQLRSGVWRDDIVMDATNCGRRKMFSFSEYTRGHMGASRSEADDSDRRLCASRRWMCLCRERVCGSRGQLYASGGGWCESTRRPYASGGRLRLTGRSIARRDRGHI